MTGRLWILGLGPGDPGWVTPHVATALEAATDLVGYAPYLARIPHRPGQERHGSDNRVELDRAGHALTLAAAGRQVAVVSSGDPGVFAMASAVFEAMEAGPAHWRHLPVQVEPGVSAMLAAAARIGAPLGHDFAVLSLSDNLKPLATVLARIEATAGAGLALALYNPVSKARPHQLDQVLDRLRALRPATVPVFFARAVGRSDERIRAVPLGEATGAMADMQTLVLVGTAVTRRIEATDFFYAPRRADGP